METLIVDQHWSSICDNFQHPFVEYDARLQISKQKNHTQEVELSSLSVQQHITIHNNVLNIDLCSISFHCYCTQYYKYFFSVLQKLLWTMHKYYDFRNIDSVSITLVFILIITVIYILNNFTALLRKECNADEGNTQIFTCKMFHFAIMSGILC